MVASLPSKRIAESGHPGWDRSRRPMVTGRGSMAGCERQAISDCAIVGRGAQRVLQDREDVFRVFHVRPMAGALPYDDQLGIAVGEGGRGDHRWRAAKRRRFLRRL